MNEKLQGAIACSAFVSFIYAVYIWGSVTINGVMPDGPLFAGILVIVGGIFGYKFAPGALKRLKAER